MKFVQIKAPKKKKIALVAHDNMKPVLSKWCATHLLELKNQELFATGTTASKITNDTGLSVSPLLSGPMGGDQQIGAKIAERSLDMLIFFWDPLASMPHDPDVKALLRIAAVWNIPVACNPSSADYLISSPLMQQENEYRVPDYTAYQQARE
ncbi:methylglyoxal synthase [Glaciecola petra]|uniref:Methylglyoxal synthase n=1 Tax=Glaciecola petra TaxID=3075602 RepID=A0ABU2ZVT7_9ALTE|nr:methylglyoxal synthase [Aestuariibacter sp. P117]MDT0596496.1 methylglyoxal synthase [Aestuariibacter sp. P117]